MYYIIFFFFFQAEDGIRDAQESRGLGDVYKRQIITSLGMFVGSEIRRQLLPLLLLVVLVVILLGGLASELVPCLGGILFHQLEDHLIGLKPVSYTHLTLPTKRIV
eukprot:TRINITY_DN15118_c0_g1_i2.p1 TRINITY_DN15118_c0_g1~~TRINITY_DN15118_c0_g1_i2.p1  ORF type:complete len:106 (-),score=25.51 TRINITY_DN15118_c0_g1_i2:47-364(-)